MTGYQLKITIKGSKPPIWRRVVVPQRISFADLDAVIECIFGWEHAHLYEFYFPKERVYISMPDDFDSDFGADFDEKFDADKACIDSWIEAGDKFEYTYDFGDNWEHTVLVEKLVPYENRYAYVIKSKGPYMIEDCGGIWDFYEYIDEACEFDLDEANEKLKHMEFEEFEDSEDFRGDGRRGGQEVYEDFFRKLRYEMAGGERIPPLELLLKDVFSGYKKENLVMIAKLHGFSRYSKFKKNELAEWLANHLLDKVYMKHMLESITRYEIQHFEASMEGGEFISEELVSESLFLCSYGAYNPLSGMLQIPKDVREKYQKLCTLDFRQKLEKEWKLIDYCDSAVYLYGIIPVNKLIEIYQHYEEETVKEDAVYAIAEKFDGEIGEGFLHEEMLMEGQFLEDGICQALLEDQKDIPYYIPKDKEEFLMYGEEECQEPDEHTGKFIIYLQDRYRLDYTEALMVFYELQSAIRANFQIPRLLGLLADMLADWHKGLNGRKDIKEAETQLKNLQNYTRVIRYRGYTQKEYLNMQSPERMQRGKVIAFPGNKKIYPNDPCPCGSGKKYKKCCGKK
ncbi:MAG: plasmid pRiA4b ORF-3 family protein [Dorea sp.]|nr:plasmid pRiA4b ORF-3 family protein [Dorea sp.]